MQFLLFDVSATLVFLASYLTVATLQHRRREVLVLATEARDAGRVAAPARRPERSAPGATRKDGASGRPPRREWPRLSAPR